MQALNGKSSRNGGFAIAMLDDPKVCLFYFYCLPSLRVTQETPADVKLGTCSCPRGWPSDAKESTFFDSSMLTMYLIIRPGRVCCRGKWVLTVQGQCFMRFGMSSISPNGWWDLFPKPPIPFNPKSYTLQPKSNMKPQARLESKILLRLWSKPQIKS